MSQKTFDYARRQRSSSPVIKRKRTVNTRSFGFSSRSLPHDLPNTTVNQGAQEVTITSRILHGLVGLVSLIGLIWTMLRSYPIDIKDFIIINAYLVIIVPLFVSLYCLSFAITIKKLPSLLLAWLVSFILFLKLQGVIFEISLILPLIAIFVIIVMIYNKNSKA